MKKYVHKVNYYETDKMGVVHHSNYVRWMEEARVCLMEQMGYSYFKLESIGICSPVLAYSCEIKHSTFFGNEVEILAKVKKYNSVRLEIEYEMMVDDKIVATGESKHCFTNSQGKPISLKKECVELDKLFYDYI